MAWQTSTSQVWILIVIGVVFASLIILYFSPSYAPKILSSAAGPYELNEQKTIIEEADSTAFYSDSNATFSAFVYLNPITRTGTYAACGSGNGSASCEDGTFAPCICVAVTGNCSDCEHKGYNSVFNISGIVGLEVLVTPDASRQGQAMVQLIVKTEGPPTTPGSSSGSPKTTPTASTSQKYIETLRLPQIPIQKWTYITVARDGRRFDVYFDNKLVLSQKTMSMPISNVTNSSMGGITSGSPGLYGQIAVANLYNYRMTSKDVSVNYAKYADTRGRPYLNISGNPLTLSDIGGIFPSYAGTLSTSLSSYIPSFSLCPSGGCFNPPTIRAATPLYDWTPSYQ
jgi:hypothetical protein